MPGVAGLIPQVCEGSSRSAPYSPQSSTKVRQFKLGIQGILQAKLLDAINQSLVTCVEMLGSARLVVFESTKLALDQFVFHYFQADAFGGKSETQGVESLFLPAKEFESA